MSTAQAVRDAEARHARLRRRLKAYGQWEPFVDAEPARRHVEAMRATGMSIAGIVQHTGVNSGSIDHLIYGKRPYPPARKIRPETARAILAFWPTLDDYEDGAVIDGTGTRRRIHALGALGWPANSIQEHVNHITIKAVERLRGARRVTARTARSVRDLYTAVSEKPAEHYGVTPWIATRTRTYAAKNGYAGPMAWDVDTIDDPQAVPVSDDRVLNFHERAALRREEIIHFAWHGYEPEQILDRLGNEVSIATVRAVVQEWRTGQKRRRPNRVRPERQKQVAA
ncbi:hypothetical protein ABZ916_39425 [Streptomyces sp. NPDC046853]|uniref:hypothetical protein n=1 Tax=Streptomyces sp. NPDC046853 TaxID=3154920 RepID=UPI00340BBDE3